MPVTKTEQASIALNKPQIDTIAEITKRPGARLGVTIEETNLENVVAVKTIPGQRVHLVAWNGSSHQIGTPE